MGGYLAHPSATAGTCADHGSKANKNATSVAKVHVRTRRRNEPKTSLFIEARLLLFESWMRLPRRLSLLSGVLLGLVSTAPANADDAPVTTTTATTTTTTASAPPVPGPGPSPSPGPAATKDAEKADRDERAEFLYADAELGIEYVDLQSLHLTNELVPSTARTSDVGPMLGVGLGARLWVFSIGPRFRYGVFSDWDLWSLDLEIGLHAPPTGPLQFEVLLAGGFTEIGQLQENRVSVTGYDFRIGLGAHYYFNHWLSLGPVFSGEVLGLARPGVDLNQSTGTLRGDVLAYDGSSIGFAVAGAAVLGFHL